MPLPANSISILTFNPAVAVIEDIVNGDETLIVTKNNHTFVVGQSVRIIIPPAMRATMTQPAYDYGMPEINGMLGNIISIDPAFPDQFFIDIDSTFFQAFTEPASQPQLAQAIPVGELNSQLNGAVKNILGPPFPLAGGNVP